MPKKRRVTKKKTIELDNLPALSTKVSDFLRENFIKIISVGTFLTIGVVSFLGWKLYSRANEAKAYNLYMDVLKEFQKDFSSFTLIPASESKEESDKKENLKRVLERFLKISKDSPNTTAAKLALYYSGTCYYRVQDYANAINSFENFLDDIPQDSFLYYSGLMELGYAYEAHGKKENAKECLQRVGDHKGNPFQERALVKLAALYDHLGDKKSALATYTKVLTLFPDAPSRMEIQQRLGELEK